MCIHHVHRSHFPVQMNREILLSIYKCKTLYVKWHLKHCLTDNQHEINCTYMQECSLGGLSMAFGNGCVIS